MNFLKKWLTTLALASVLCSQVLQADNQERGCHSSFSGCCSHEQKEKSCCKEKNIKRYVTVSDGVMLFTREYRAKGGDAKPTLFFLHGISYSSKFWRCVQEYYCERGFNSVSYDARGHGFSDKGDDLDYTPERLTTDPLEVVQQFKLENPIWVGFSVGGITTLGAAAGLGNIPIDGLIGQIVLVDTQASPFNLLFPLPPAGTCQPAEQYQQRVIPPSQGPAYQIKPNNGTLDEFLTSLRILGFPELFGLTPQTAYPQYVETYIKVTYNDDCLKGPKFEQVVQDSIKIINQANPVAISKILRNGALFGGAIANPYFTISENIKCIDIPTFVMHGNLDESEPLQSGLYIWQNIIGAQLMCVPRRSHNIPVTDFPGFVHALDIWLGRDCDICNPFRKDCDPNYVLNRTFKKNYNSGPAKPGQGGNYILEGVVPGCLPQ